MAATEEEGCGRIAIHRVTDYFVQSVSRLSAVALALRYFARSCMASRVAASPRCQAGFLTAVSRRGEWRQTVLINAN